MGEHSELTVVGTGAVSERTGAIALEVSKPTGGVASVLGKFIGWMMAEWQACWSGCW